MRSTSTLNSDALEEAPTATVEEEPVYNKLNLSKIQSALNTAAESRGVPTKQLKPITATNLRQSSSSSLSLTGQSTASGVASKEGARADHSARKLKTPPKPTKNSFGGKKDAMLSYLVCLRCALVLRTHGCR